VSKRKRKSLGIYDECACGEYCSSCLTTTASGEVKCSNCVAPVDARRGTCRCCWKANVPLEAHHIAGWRCSDRTVDVCINCHRKLSIMLQPFMELQGRHDCDPVTGFFYHLIGFGILFYATWHRGDVDLQPFLKSNRQARSSRKTRT
jgi:hypothetical protein